MVPSTPYNSATRFRRGIVPHGRSTDVQVMPGTHCLGNCGW